jgi:hypothetical protein
MAQYVPGSLQCSVDPRLLLRKGEAPLIALQVAQTCAAMARLVRGS